MGCSEGEREQRVCLCGVWCVRAYGLLTDQLVLRWRVRIAGAPGAAMSLRGAQGQAASADLDETQEQKLAALRARLGSIPPGSGRPLKHSAVPLRARLKKLLSHPYMLVVIVLLGW